MVKKSTIVATSAPVPVQEVKPEEIEKVKLVENLKSTEAPIKKTKKTKKDVPATTPLKEEVPVFAEPVKEEIVDSVVAAPPTETEVIVPETEVDENAEVVEDSKKRTRRVVTKESFYDDFEGFVETTNLFLESVGKNEKIGKNARNVIFKKLKQLQNDSYKLLKIRHLKDEKKPKMDNNSGFMKPIKISEDLATFLKTNPEEPITRVIVTKKLCQYIKDKDLQNPADRREIVPDDSLKSLFRIGDNTEENKLTYYSMQKQIQQHIFKI